MEFKNNSFQLSDCDGKKQYLLEIIQFYNSKKIYEIIGDMFTIFDLKNYLSTVLDVPQFQLGFNINRQLFDGCDLSRDKELVKDIGTTLRMKNHYYTRISQFVVSSYLEHHNSRIMLGELNVIYLRDSQYSEMVKKCNYLNNYYLLFQIYRNGNAEIILNESFFKLSRLSIENKKIKRTEIKIIVDPKSFVYMINNIATVVCQIPLNLENGIYESSFEGNIKIHNYSFDPESKYTSWFIVDDQSMDDQNNLNCCVCLDFNNKKDHLICGNCLTIECKQCVDKYYSNRRNEEFICPVCRKSMVRQ